MQVVGTRCEVCAQPVVAASEATWCAACRTVLHAVCIAARGEICPTCRAPRDAPERHFVDTRMCTKCLRLYPHPASACAACGAGMRFDDAAALERRAGRIRRFALGRLLLGAGLTLGGVSILSVAALTYPGAAAIAGGTVLLLLGARTIWVGQRLLHFC